MSSIYSQQQTATYTYSPTPTFEGTDALTITVNGSSLNESLWGVSNNQLYAWVWALDTANTLISYNGNGTWDNSDASKLMTYNSANDTYSFTYNPNVFNFFGSTNVAKVGFLIKAKNGNGDKKSQDIVLNVGSFQVTLLNGVVAGGTQLCTSTNTYTISARHTTANADYVLKRNNVIVNTQSALAPSTTTASYNYTDNSVEDFNNYLLEVTQNGITKSFQFFAIKIKSSQILSMSSGLEDGINYGSDTSKATLVLTAPNKDFIYVVGSFNNWQINSNYLMKKDPATGKFWLEVSGLSSGNTYAYQYWVCDNTNVPTNSPKIVKTADPFSTLVLSPFDDPEIITLGNYPNLPVYATIAPGQEREVTVLQTGQTPYNWQVTSFTKPKKEDLVIYEVLVRDFDSPRTFQSLINRIDYFKNLKINAIELMPVMEFEGNEGWGYSPCFHLALDKYYGSASKLKEFIDLCHQNGIAVILDVALNHAMGRNPMVRMWMTDPENDGWGGPSSENPYFNVTATHSYGVGSDFNHSSALTKYYSKRMIKQWVQEFKIDGFRWDLTKGFTQNATGSDYQTNTYQADRVAVLKEYADYSWSLDPNHYVIFEHLGTIDGSLTEETEWANYRYNEGKGIMLWGEMTWAYRQLTMGWNTSDNITRMGSDSRGFTGKRLVGYPESHDKERLMYDNLTYGNNTNSSHNVRDLNTALSRMSALGAASIMIPGPKMLWHFADLGMNLSIFTCTDGSVNTDSDAIAGDCKLATKPQPQWSQNWLAVTQRSQIYNNWSKMNNLKINEPVFEGSYTIDSNDTDLTPRIFVWNDAIPSTQLKNVVVLTNFEVTAQNIVPDFPYTGTWYNLMDNSTLNVTSTTAPINIEAGGYRIYGNKPSSYLADESLDNLGEEILIYPNPAQEKFFINVSINQIEIYDTTGKLIKKMNNSSTHFYDVSDLKPSVYVVKVLTKTGMSNQKLIIN